jgi:Host cell surface-exposed lipoprotein
LKLVVKIALGIILAVLLLSAGCSALLASDPEVRKATTALEDATVAPEESEPAKAAEPAEPAEPAETAEQENARRSAESYIDTAAFSRSGLIAQLKYEGYSRADATYAVDAIAVDWNEQAAKSAQSYLDTSPFSRSGLIAQLKYEGFTQAQATYGVNAAGL